MVRVSCGCGGPARTFHFQTDTQHWLQRHRGPCSCPDNRLLQFPNCMLHSPSNCGVPSLTCSFQSSPLMSMSPIT
jgi:hypothetical protein